MTNHPTPSSASVLVVDDGRSGLRPLARQIRAQGFSVLTAGDDRKGLALLEKNTDISVVVITHNSSHMGAAGFIHRARQLAPESAFLVLGPLDAFLYLSGEIFRFSGADLPGHIGPILQSILARLSLAPAGEDAFEKRDSFGPIIGKSWAMNRIYQMIDQLKDSSATVLIQGESGTGKELVARTLHEISPRKGHPFVAVNCGAIPKNLVESQLFGHERGAFTTAVSRFRGTFEQADSGTLFLDEIAELDSDLQVKLLRVLQEKQFQRVGGTGTLRVRARILAASNVDLAEAMAKGGFRQDLFYRLNVVPLVLPPVRERPGDIGLLLDHFFTGIARGMNRPIPMISPSAGAALLAYDYPGNVREMANIVERLLVTCPGQTIGRGDLPPELNQGESRNKTGVIGDLPDTGVSLKSVEKELILKTLKKTRGNKKKAARTLGITRRLLYLRLSEYDTGASCHPR